MTIITPTLEWILFPFKSNVFLLFCLIDVNMYVLCVFPDRFFFLPWLIVCYGTLPMYSFKWNPLNGRKTIAVHSIMNFYPNLFL